MKRLMCLIVILFAGTSSPLLAGGVGKVLDMLKSPEMTGIGKGVDYMNKILKAQSSGSKLPPGFDPLTQDDAAFANCYSAPGAPQVPSQCAGTEKCGVCFDEAYENLNRQRFRLCKLQRIYKSMMRMGKNAIAFGDDASAVHGAAGLGWQLQGRKPIEESMASFQRTCEAKYEEIIGDLHGALLEVAACEGEFYGAQDWYNRFGSIYYSFMADSFRPDDYL